MNLLKFGVARGLVIASLALFVLPSGVAAKGGKDARTRQPLLRAAGLEDPDDLRLKGEVRTRARSDRQEFEVKLEYAVQESTYDLWLDASSDPAVTRFEFIGEIGDDDDDDDSEKKYRARVRAGRGGSLPLGASTVADLYGTKLEVRRGGVTVLEGTVGNGGRASEPRWRVREELEPAIDYDEEGARARIRVRSRPSRGDERLEIKIGRLTLPEGEALVLYMEDPANPGGELVEVGPLERKRANQWRYRARTRKGDPLPFGVQSVRDLGGLDLEIRTVNVGSETDPETPDAGRVVFQDIFPSPR